MSNIFLKLYNFFESRRMLLFLVFFFILILLGFFASRVKLQENILQMLPSDEKSEQLAGFFSDSKFSDRVVIVVTQKDTLAVANPENIILLADSLVANLQDQLPQYISSINHVASDSAAAALLEVIDENLPVFLEENDYKSIDSLITNEGIRTQVENNYKTLTGPGGIGMKQFILKDPLGLNFIGYKKLNSLQVDEQVELYDGHYLTKNHLNLVMYLNLKYPSSETDKNDVFFSRLDEIIASFSHSQPESEIIYFGAPAVAAGNAKQIRADTTLTVIITIILLLLIVLLFFRNATAPLLIITPVVFGALFALALIYFIQGSISVIAVGAGSLVLGIAVNYSMHFLTHYRFHPDVRGTIHELAFPMIAGSLTTIGGFLCLRFVNAPVLQDLGLFAALSLAGAAIATLVFLPHFISSKQKPLVPTEPSSFINKLNALLPSHKMRVFFIVMLTPVLFYFAGDVAFESDMYKINYMSKELRAAEEKMNRVTSFYQKSIFVITSGNSQEAALQSNEKLTPVLNKLKSNGGLITYSSVSTVLPSLEEQEKRIARWNNYWTSDKRQRVFDQLLRSGEAFRFKESAFTPFLDKTQQQSGLLPAEAEITLKQVLLDNLIEEKNGEWTLIGMIKTTPGNANVVYRELDNFKASSAFDRKYITDKLMAIVSADFNFITLWTSLLVLFALFVIYGRIELALLTFIPMIVSWIWILGLMALLDIKFNIVNIVLSTFIFALGDDFCIFTTDGLQQEYARKVKNIKSLRVSIALSATTTIIGMGVLIFAQHPALSSIALVSIIGILSVWFISQTLQPVLFRFLITNPTAHKHEPYTFFNILKSVFAFSYFIFGSILISILGILLMKLIPVKSPGIKYAYHWILSKFAGSMIYIMSNVKKRIINLHGEDFSKPAVIIANHSSFLDILLLIMMHPKLILLTNKWVWNSPVFGMAVRMAEYYPVAEGAENTTTRLAEKIAAGYSIVVFPEGTRSVDGTIGRFHKGAFFLAENLKVDLLPIVIHGAAHTMTKGFFYLKNGQLTLNILPRIQPGDDTYGSTYQEKSKQLRKYFTNQLNQLADQVETPEYFKEYLFSNFIYKGPVLEWYMKIKVRIENNYKFFTGLIPVKGHVLDIGCGYGFLAYMLSYTSRERIITGIDYDESKISIAQNGYAKNSRTNFHHANALTYDFDFQDAIILNDVLHYLAEGEQEKLLQKCIGRLNPEGMLVIRDGVTELQKRHRGTRLSELFSTRLLGFNKTAKQGLHYISSQLIESVAHQNNLTVTVTDPSRWTSNIIFVLKKSA
ncbi:MAG: 1-acyl-sn-glycerol-3-phosphate acyltransferase [Bacteroidota bacterium]|nr:1-acyl-sn-glycerol-3-phosphate acyltransferase [Bacteroidota bacterium]